MTGLLSDLVSLRFFDVFRLKLFQRLDRFRVIVFGGDGSIGWVLSAVDKLQLHSKVCVCVCVCFVESMVQRVSLLCCVRYVIVLLFGRWAIVFVKSE